MPENSNFSNIHSKKNWANYSNYFFQIDSKIRSNRIDSKWGCYATCMACSYWANIPEAIHRCLELSTIPNEAINREPQRVATWATAAPTDTDHRTAYLGGSSKKIMAVASTVFPPGRSVKRDENQAIDPKYRGKAPDFDSCIAVAVPCVGVEGFLRPPKRGWVWCSFLSCASKKKRLSSASKRRCTPRTNAPTGTVDGNWTKSGGKAPWPGFLCLDFC